MEIVIMAGGSGTRLWPLSTEDNPKQFTKINLDKSLLENTFDRLNGLSKNKMFVSSVDCYKKRIIEELGHNVTIITKPIRKNTAVAIAHTLQSLLFNGINEKDPILFVPADHLIEPKESFQKYVLNALKAYSSEDILIFGIEPTYPNTGYGYIKIEKSKGYKNKPFLIVESFKEKPNIELAKEYIKSKEYYWNSGMFMLSYDTIKKEFKKISKDIYPIFETKTIEELNETIEKMPNTSFDKEIMEKTKLAKVIPMNINWSDIGSRDSVYENGNPDTKNNVINGNFAVGNTSSSLLLSNLEQKIIIDGVDDIIIVADKNGIYITKKGNSQNIKNFL